MLWPEIEDRPKDPERQLLDAIAAGELDEHLVAIADAVHPRRQLLLTVRSAKAIAELCVGDTVMFTNRIRPRYLGHELAEVTEGDAHAVTVRLWRPVGRFGASFAAHRSRYGSWMAERGVRAADGIGQRRRCSPAAHQSRASWPCSSRYCRVRAADSPPPPLSTQNFHSSRAERV